MHPPSWKVDLYVFDIPPHGVGPAADPTFLNPIDLRFAGRGVALAS